MTHTQNPTQNPTMPQNKVHHAESGKSQEFYDALLRKQRAFFQSGKTRDVSFRTEQLNRLKKAVQAFEPAILNAVKQDMNRPTFEGFTAEVGMCLDEISYATKNIRKWSRPTRVPTPITHFISSSRIIPEPVGVVLIIAPWNYPFQLAIAPLIAAMSAGNCAIVKPSELAPATSAVIAKLIGETFSSEYVAAVEGGVEVTTALLKERFDHVFFTGGTAVGRVILEAAAKHLTPVTLELGGKSPCIVDKNIPIEQTARRIAWGKFFNAGQTCVAPDYLLVHRSVKDPLIAAMKNVLHEFYGADPSKSADFGRIINERHFNRLTALLTKANIAIGGQSNAAERYIAPTIVDQVSLGDAIMGDEIFGPILPVLTYDTLDEALAIVQQRAKPLALYLFTGDRTVEARVLREVQFGGGCVNDTLIHLSSSHLPFGGIGPSGMGAYHGKAGFDLFSHKKSVLKKTALFDIKLRYAPYSKLKLSIVKRLFA